MLWSTQLISWVVQALTKAESQSCRAASVTVILSKWDLLGPSSPGSVRIFESGLIVFWEMLSGPLSSRMSRLSTSRY
ncbi:hypothetical protein LINPERHAP1_LOCUS21083 [Linum perenne]